MKLSILLFLLFLAACHHLPPTLRSEYRLIEVDDFVLSNIYVHPWTIEDEEEKISFDYKVIIKNTLDQERSINTSGSSILIGLRKIPIHCATLEGRKQQFVMKKHETLAVVCEVRINKEEGMFQISDYKSVIEIPLVKESVQFAYLLRAEDFK